MSHIALQSTANKNIKVSQAANLVRIYCQQTGKKYPTGSNAFINVWKRYNIKASYQN